MPSVESSRTLTLEDLKKSPNPLARHYSRFRVAERLLLTGHSHQAWPDVGFEGQTEAWNDAAAYVDEKWPRAYEKAERVRRGYARLLGDRDGAIALAQGTHDLLVKFLSALPLRERPRLVTTDGEFHSIRRQLDRIAEEGVLEVVKVSATPATAVAERLIAATNPRTAAVLASSVLYANAHVVPGLGSVLAHCRRVGAELLVDAYHQLNVLPFSLDRDGLADAFVTGGGYKYCQLGEGNAYLRVPPGREHLRPVVTGWFSEFAHLSESVKGGVAYGEGPARWAAATYDPTSNYRAARVFDFFEAEGLTPELLREVYARQVALLAERFDAMDLDPALITRDRSVPLSAIGGFLALLSPRSAEIAKGLRSRGVLIDIRGATLRLGPSPYLSDAQLHAAMDALGETARSL
jgi:kynureninase